MAGRYKQAYTRSLADPEGFWLEAARLIDWTVPPSVALDVGNPPFYRWYPDTDDVINVAGHRLSTGAIEAAIAAHPDVAECAVIGIPDPLKGHISYALVVLKAGADPDPA